MLISRIQAADASIPSDLGRDVSTVQALQRKHQVTSVNPLTVEYDIFGEGSQISTNQK